MATDAKLMLNALGGYEPFVWRCDWRVARFASLTDMLLVIYRVGSCANSLRFVAFVGNACSTNNGS